MSPTRAGRLRANRWLILLAVLAGVLGYFFFGFVRMPGHRSNTPPTPNTDQQKTADILYAHVHQLATKIGVRDHVSHRNREAAAYYIEGQFKKYGLNTSRHTFQHQRRQHSNVQAEITGLKKPEEIVIIGAHYDTAPGSPGANDNASGVAALLEIARRMADHEPVRTLRFVAFTNEEPPNFGISMGSQFYAKDSYEKGENIIAMISLEMLGYFSDEPGSQRYPAGLDRIYPDRGNFIAFIGNISSRGLVAKCKASFGSAVDFPFEATALPERIPGVSNSDHASFWEFGYPALMVTDTAMFRYPHYHKESDTTEKLKYDRMAIVVDGLTQVVQDLVD